MKKAITEILPIIALVMILSPVASSLKKKSEEAARPQPTSSVRSTVPAPEVKKPVTDPVAWFASIRSECTPADVTLATDLNRPPEGVEGTGYKAACFALAHQVPRARALLLGLPEADRLRGTTVVYDVAQDLAARGRRTTAGPLMELVLEFWPNNYVALYEAGSARYAVGDLIGAQAFLARFLEEYDGNDDLSSNAQRMMVHMAER